MIPMGPGLRFSLRPGWPRVLGLLPRRFSVLICGGIRRERAGASPPPGGAYRIFSLGYNQGNFSLCILHIYLMYFVNLS